MSLFLPFINTIAPYSSSFTKEAITTAEHIETFKKAYEKKLQAEGNLFAKDEVKEAAERYIAIAQDFIDNTIPIPRLSIVPSGKTKLIFHDFDLDTSKMKYRPGVGRNHHSRIAVWQSTLHYRWTRILQGTFYRKSSRFDTY